MKKIVVSSKEEALKLISEGVNSMLIFSPEAQHGYKKDGSIAGKRGRKPLLEEIKISREKKVNHIVITPNAPHGIKKDGNPMKKRGRPSKELIQPQNVCITPEVIFKSPLEPENNSVDQNPSNLNDGDNGALMKSNEVIEEAVTGRVLKSLEVNKTIILRSPALDVSILEKGMRVRVKGIACVGERCYKMMGFISKIDLEGKFVYISWDDGSEEYRTLKILEAI